MLILQKKIGTGNTNWSITDISLSSYDGISYITSEATGYPFTARFSPDGSKMYVGDQTTGIIHQYNTTNFDLTSMSYSGITYASGLVITGVAFSNDGTKLYINHWTNKSLYEYTLSSAWDISTAVFSSSIPLPQDNTPKKIRFNPDGTIMYWIGSTINAIYQYNLSTPYDITTADSYVPYFTLYGPGGAQAFAFNPEGTQLYHSDENIPDSVYQYSLSTAWDITSASYTGNSYNVTGQITASPIEIEFNLTGSKMFLYTSATKQLFQYST